MKTNLNHDHFDFLMALAEDCAKWQLGQLTTFNNAFFFVTDSQLVCAWAERDGSTDPFQNFIAAIRHLAISKNVTAGVFIERFERVSVPPPEKCPFSPAPTVTEYVLLLWQSRTEELTFFFPVHRHADGTFSHFGQFLPANPLSWVPNIIPKQAPSAAQRLTADSSLQPYKLNLETKPIDPGA